MSQRWGTLRKVIFAVLVLSAISMALLLLS